MIKNYVEKIKKFILNKENKKYTVIGAIVIFTICFFVFDLGGLLGRVFTSIGSLFSNVDGEVKHVVIKSDGYDEGTDGSVKITKSADWTASSTATLTYSVESNMSGDTLPRDVIILLDTSKRLSAKNLAEIKADIIELSDLLITINGENKMGIITFSNSSKVLLPFTNDEALIESKLDDITVSGDSSYYMGLVGLKDYLVNNYVVDNNRQLVILFVTDGYPVTNSSNQKVQYDLVKKEFPNSTIYGIDYKSGATIIDSLKEVSDVQIKAGEYETPLIEASLNPEYYETFEIIETISSKFYIESVDNISVTTGIVKLENNDGKQVVRWMANGNQYRTGHINVMEIELKLKDDYVRVEGLYSTSEKTNVSYNLLGQNVLNIENGETPILKNGYKVSYDSNYIGDCDSNFELNEVHYAYDIVTLSKEKLECNGWQFKGWSSTTDIDYLNDETFIMPSYDVTIRGKWSKLLIDKKMDGSVISSTTNEYLFDYTGDYQTFTVPSSGTYKIELWGAQGGSYDETYAGGHGGYASGTIKLKKGQVLYVYVGGTGDRMKASTQQLVSGGYNGGGDSSFKNDSSSTKYVSVSGGGATDIRLVDGFFYDSESLLSRIMVAGGGGGSNYYNSTNRYGYGGAGGGLIGIDGTSKYNTSYKGIGGTQTKGGTGYKAELNGKFGLGGNGDLTGSWNGAGGGGGWYGGSAGYAYQAAGGGGSGFVLSEESVANVPEGYSPSALYYFSNVILLDGTQEIPTHDGLSTMIGNSGNGYAKITFLG